MPNVVIDWLGEHVALPADLTAEQLAADLVRVGLEEEAIHPATVTGPLVVGRVLDVTGEPQKNGKTINWCHVDVGPHNAPGDDGRPAEPRGIICGAHNFAAGDLVAVALPGAVLPGPFPITSRKTYGHVSDGMICSVRELGLGEDHSGIMVLTEHGYDEAAGFDLTPGADLIGPLGLGDEVLEINITPDRGYCFSYRGVAREYAHSGGIATTATRFTDPGLGEADLPGATPDGFAVEVADSAPIHGVVGCDRFVTRIVRGIDPAAPAPEWMRRRLKLAGMRPISLAVDVTNYVMLDLGQPLHAYDLDRVAAPIVVRRAAPGERLVTLDNVDRTLDPQDLLITDSPAGARGARILGLAGVMGGASSEISETTRDVLIEAAHFDPVTVARTARRHKLPSEAAKRFERGVDPRLPLVAATRVADLLCEYGGGVLDEAISDLDRVPEPAGIAFRPGAAERLIGVAYSAEQVRDVLTAIGCVVDGTDDAGAGTATAADALWQVTPPSWRPDLTGPADLVEEIARLVGYDQIPSELPPAPAGRGLTRGQRVRRSVARALAEAGFVEVLSYPFAGAAEHDALRLPADDARRRAVRLVNPLADDRPELRTSVLATLLETARRNVGRGLGDVAVFELGLVTLPAAGAPAAPALPGGALPDPAELAAVFDAVPAQPRHVAGVLAGRRVPPGWWGPGRDADWTDALAAARAVADRVGVDLRAVPDADRAPWHPGRCARLELADGTPAGWAGELHPKVVENLGLPARACAFEVDLDAMLAASSADPVQARPISAFPPVKEDLALVVAAEVPVAAVRDAVAAGCGDLLEDVRLFDVFTGPQVGEGRKSLAFSLRLRAADRTLTAADAARVRAAAVAAAYERTGAELRA